MAPSFVLCLAFSKFIAKFIACVDELGLAETGVGNYIIAESKQTVEPVTLEGDLGWLGYGRTFAVV